MTSELNSKYAVAIEGGIVNASASKLNRRRMLVQWVLDNRHNGVNWNEQVGYSSIYDYTYYSEILFDHQYDRTACILLFSDILS
jgi:hypothetical protein